MKKRMVWRYTCDFCGKSNCSGGSISKHELHCTKNPKRVCRMCAAVGDKQPSFDELAKASKMGVSELRIAANNCPACILTALRVAYDPEEANPSDDGSFHWKKEREAWIEDYHYAMLEYDSGNVFDREEWNNARAKRFCNEAAGGKA